MSIKNHVYSLIIGSFFFFNCGGEDSDTIPPVTDRIDSAKNSLSCVVNGEPFVATTSFGVVLEFNNNIRGGTEIDRFQSVVRGVELSLPQNIEVKTYPVVVGEDELSLRTKGLFFEDGNEGKVIISQSGQVVVESFDGKQIKGTFEFASTFDTITDGKFDVQLLPQ